jgi:integrase
VIKVTFKEKWARNQRRRQRLVTQSAPEPEPIPQAEAKEREKVLITPAEWARIRNAMYARGGKFAQRALLYDIMYNTGASIGEATALTREDFHFEEKDGKIIRVHVNITKMKDDMGTGVHALTKWHHLSRTAPVNCMQNDPNDIGVRLPPFLQRRCPSPKSMLFPWTKNNALKRMRLDAETFGFRFRSHDFRRTLLTDLARTPDVSVMDAAELAGHRRVTTTEKYFLHERASPGARTAKDKLSEFRRGEKQ